MTTEETCSRVAPCRLCMSKIAESPQCPIFTMGRRGNRPHPNPMGLPEIVVPDKEDFVAMKRAGNTMAARKSRQRQLDHTKKLERQAKELTAERNHWMNWALSFQEQGGWMFPPWIAFQVIHGEEATHG